MELPEQPADLYECERIARSAGFRKVIGIDEAGRGPLAGPVVAAAVHLPPHKELPGINDSKQLSAKQRENLYAAITQDPEIHWAVAVLGAREVDKINIYQAACEAMRQAAAEIDEADFILVDGNPVHDLPCPARNIVKGDAKCACIAAASIVAKVHRDRLMHEYDELYPGYGFAAHKGYGTTEHLEALARLGPCPIHRRTFSPVARVVNAARQGELDL